MDQSPLKKLAPELRNQIYELILTAPGPISCRFSRKDQAWICDLKHKYGDLLAITETCREMHSECNEMLYAINTFELKTEPENLRDRFREFQFLIESNPGTFLRSVAFDIGRLNRLGWSSAHRIHASMRRDVGLALDGLRDVSQTNPNCYFELRFKVSHLDNVDLKIAASDVDLSWDEKVAQLIPEKEDARWTADREVFILSMAQCRMEDHERYKNRRELLASQYAD